jgi:hypothetical protein
MHQLGDMLFDMLERLDERTESKIEDILKSRVSVLGTGAGMSSPMSHSSTLCDANEPVGFATAFTKLGRTFARTLVATDPMKISLVQENRVDIFKEFVQFFDTTSTNADVIEHIKKMSKATVRSSA